MYPKFNLALEQDLVTTHPCCNNISFSVFQFRNIVSVS